MANKDLQGSTRTSTNPGASTHGVPWPLVAGVYLAVFGAQLLLLVVAIFILGGEAHASQQLPPPHHQLVWMLYTPVAWFGVNCIGWFACRRFRIRQSISALIVAIQPMPVGALLLALLGLFHGEAAIATGGMIMAALYGVSILAALKSGPGSVPA